MNQKNSRAQAMSAYHAHMAYGQQEPTYMGLALVAINRWGRQEQTLAHAVALALKEAYEAGRSGKELIRPVFAEPEIPEEEIEEVVVTPPRTVAPGRVQIRIKPPEPPSRVRVQVRRRG